ncbi:lysozyme inhibitor LprI family protein [Paraburkholderia rhynchosiae]|uniref:DUF1311 domain-containing protein n=1 Tax=Paraburkholderia rhynchosiae TaxID=487049 RepID=A0A2N7WWC1_9BURK|nr:hypothetical protein [Paraburkholderia rhynchosiae]PMS33535.1 hypothetical protein C0Z16_02855 [Paraburkholderia rhynchosiae]CAB3680314.1 hypothetical protein LMG27174_02624 [Paraburkholderia rhynchosiae]
MKNLRPVLIAALLIAHSPAHATSFNCNKGRSLTEKMICNDPALSRLDDTLGQLYWKARRRVTDRRGFITDSDSKWAWREANCRDTVCLGTWYATRIEELQRLTVSVQAGASGAPVDEVKPADTVTPAQQDSPRKPLPAPASAPAPAPSRIETARLQCTAARPGIVIGEQCSTVIRQNGSQWKYRPHGGDWFCGVAMLGHT